MPAQFDQYSNQNMNLFPKCFRFKNVSGADSSSMTGSMFTILWFSVFFEDHDPNCDYMQYTHIYVCFVYYFYW